MPGNDELASALRYVGRELHELHKQMAADADERRNTREDEAIYDHLLSKLHRLARRFRAVDDQTP